MQYIRSDERAFGQWVRIVGRGVFRADSRQRGDYTHGTDQLSGSRPGLTSGKGSPQIPPGQLVSQPSRLAHVAPQSKKQPHAEWSNSEALDASVIFVESTSDVPVASFVRGGSW